MVMEITGPRLKIYRTLDEVTSKMHQAPLEEGPVGKGYIHKNMVFLALTYLLGRNHALVGQPGWGKTTGAKIIAARLSGLPYDLYDSLEVRGHPMKSREDLVGRFDYGVLNKDGKERVIWNGGLALPVLIIDELARLSPEAQDIMLQGIETSRWNYFNASHNGGKRPTYMTLNQVDGNRDTIVVPAFLDRIDITTEAGFFGAMMLEGLEDNAAEVVARLHDPAHTKRALAMLAGSAGVSGSEAFEEFSKFVSKPSLRLAKLMVSQEELRQAQNEIAAIGIREDARYLLMSFFAETNYSDQFGFKRAEDNCNTENTHDAGRAVANLLYGVSPRTAMAVKAYARALAWFLGDGEVGTEHIRYVFPLCYAHKAAFTPKYLDAVEKERRRSWLPLAAASKLTEEMYARHVQSAQLVINIVAKMQRHESLTPEEQKKSEEAGKIVALTKFVMHEKLSADDEALVRSMSECEEDHPLFLSFLRIAREYLCEQSSVYSGYSEEG